MDNLTSAMTHVFYEKHDGEPCLAQLEPGSSLSVSGWNQDRDGLLADAPPRWVARASTPEQALGLVRKSITTAFLGGAVGVWWDRTKHDGPMPVTSDRSQYWHAVVTCDDGFPVAIGCTGREEAERILSSWPCGPERCWTDPIHWDGEDECWHTFHRLERMTVAEANFRLFALYVPPSSRSQI